MHRRQWSWGKNNIKNQFLKSGYDLEMKRNCFFKERTAYEILFWVGCLGAMVVAGFMAGLVGRSVGVWESYLAWLVTLA